MYTDQFEDEYLIIRDIQQRCFNSIIGLALLISVAAYNFDKR